jgi:dihydroorotase
VSVKFPKTVSIIAGGRIIDPASGIDAVGDVYLKGGVIDKIELKKKALKTTAEMDAERSIADARGLIVAPGFIDVHVHLREPGREDEETIESGARAAAAGGFTSVCCMPNTDPPIDDQETVQFVIDQARDAACRVYPIGAITQGQRGEFLTEIGDMVAAGAVGISEDGKSVASAEVQRRAMEYVRMFDIPVISHCEDAALANNGVMNEGTVSTLLGMSGQPGAAEEIMVARDIQLAAFTGARLHIAHVSTAGSVKLIKRGKRDGVRVTGEAAPHHFSLIDRMIAESFNSNLRVNPPLRTEKDRKAVIAALADGTLDCIATDHAPHSVEEKDNEFDKAPPGMVGLETALGLVGKVLVVGGFLGWPRAIELLSTNPAKIVKVPGGTLAEGAPADITVFNPDEEWTVAPEKFFSLSHNSPFAGWSLTGRVKMTICRGKVTHIDE